MRRGLILWAKLGAATVALTVISCKREKCDDLAPTLEFREYTYIPADASDPFSADTLKLSFKFTDCQGDVGVSSGEIKNLQTFLYESINGQWVRFMPADSADTNLLFAQVPASNKIKVGSKIEGIIEQPFGSIKQTSDTIRFETRLLDREGHASEPVVTPTFIFPN